MLNAIYIYISDMVLLHFKVSCCETVTKLSTQCLNSSCVKIVTLAAFSTPFTNFVTNENYLV